MTRVVESNLQFDTKIKGGEFDPPIKDKDYVETIFEGGIAVKYVFKDRDNKYVNPDELNVTIKGQR